MLIVVQTSLFEHYIHNIQRIKREHHVLTSSIEILLKSLVLNPTKPKMTLNDTQKTKDDLSLVYIPLILFETVHNVDYSDHEGCFAILAYRVFVWVFAKKNIFEWGGYFAKRGGYFSDDLESVVCLS